MIPASFQIRDLTIRPAAVLAPMAGVTDTLFRRVIRGLGSCGLLMTEFTSSEGITRSAKKTLRYLFFEEDEHPIAAQLFGANPKVMADAARMVEDLGYDAVDINLGCPAKKVVKCGGSGLLRELPLLEEIFKGVRAAVKIPLTIQLRAGWARTRSSRWKWSRWPSRSAWKRRRFIRVRERRATRAKRTGTSSRR